MSRTLRLTIPKTIHRKAFLMFLMIVSTSSSFSQESTFKALFIYKFSEYINWPNEPSEINVGVLGSTEVFRELEKLADTKPGFNVKRIDSPAEASNCQIVFIPRAERGSASLYNSQIGAKSILLVSEDQSLVGQHADMGFYKDGNKIRFTIDESSIRSKGLHPSTKLLSLGKSI